MARSWSWIATSLSGSGKTSGTPSKQWWIDCLCATASEFALPIRLRLHLSGAGTGLLCRVQLSNIERRTSNAEPEQWEQLRYSTDYGNTESGFTLGELTPKHFSFNSHLGACPACHGLG